MSTSQSTGIHLTLHAYQARILQRFLKAWGPPVWIVGGMVRDRLLELPPGHDLDLVVPSPQPLEDQDWIPESWQSFCLDRRRHIWRLVSHPSSRHESVRTVDLVVLSGSDIEDDLGRRDFRVNAMAIPVASVHGTCVAGPLLDPQGGRGDLKRRTLVPVSEHNLLADPLRMLRGVRLAHATGFALSSELRSFIGEYGHLGGRAARERVGPEVWKLVAAPASSIRHVARDLDEMNLGSLIAGPSHSGFALFDDNMGWLSVLQDWARTVTGNPGRLAPCPHPMGADMDVAVDLGQMGRAWLGPGRMRGDWWVMAAVLWLMFRDGQASTSGTHMRTWAARCAFSAGEQRWLAAVGTALDHVWHRWLQPPQQEGHREPMVIECHRLMEKTGWHLGWPALQDACVIIAPLARETGGATPTRLAAIQSTVSHLWRLGRSGPVRPMATGRDLQDWYALPQGPEIGRLLGLLTEAQVLGRVATPGEARRFLDDLLYH